MLKRAAQVALVLALCPVISFAQTEHVANVTPQAENGASASDAAQGDEASAINLLTIVLRLNDSQQRETRAAFDAALKTAAPISAKIQAHKSSVFEAVRSGKTEEQIKTVAAEQGALTSEMLLLQAQTFAKLWAILNSDQKAQMDDFVYGNIRLILPASPQ